MEDLKNRIMDEVKKMGEHADPSPSAIAVMQREISSLKELVMGKIEDIKEEIKQTHEDAVRVPTIIDKEIKTIRDFFDEKISRREQVVGEQFKGIDQRFADGKTALDMALTNQKEVNAKSESGTTKQIDALLLLINNAATGLQGQINDLKDRVLRSEGSKTGQTEQRGMQKDLWAYIVGGIGILLAAIQYFNR